MGTTPLSGVAHSFRLYTVGERHGRGIYDSSLALGYRHSSTGRLHEEPSSPTGRASDHRIDPKRKHHRTIQELEEETERMRSIDISPRDKSADHAYAVLEAWMEISKDGHGIRAPRQARGLLYSLEQRHNTVLPTSFYDVVLHAYALSRGGLEAATEAHNLLQHMIQLSRSSKLKYPTIKTWNIVINAWAKSGVKDSGLRAEAILEELNSWNRHLQEHALPLVEPTEVTMVSVIDAWARSRHSKAPERVLSLLDQSVRSGKANSRAFNAVIQTLVQSNRGREAAVKAEEVLRMMLRLAENQPALKPSTRSYSVVINAWAKCESQEAAQRAHDMLTNMVDKYREGMEVEPNDIAFTTCISAWSKCRNVRHAPERAEALLTMLSELYKETGKSEFKPSVRTYNAVIAAWVRASGRCNAVQQGERALEEMKFANPNLVSYNTLLGGMGRRGMGVEALRLLDWLDDEGGDMKPDRISFNSALAALAKDKREGSAEKAETLLRRMEGSEQGADKFSYTTVVDAWARSIDPNKASKAETLLNAMISQCRNGRTQSEPDVFVFTAVIKACLQSPPQTESQADELLSIALRTMEKLDTGRYGKPNHVTYSTLLSTIHMLCSSNERRLSLLKQTFQNCVANGYVSKKVIHALPRELRDHIPSMLPAEWEREVPPRDRKSS